MLKWSQMAPLAGIPPGVEPVRSRMLCGSDSFRDEGERRECAPLKSYGTAGWLGGFAFQVFGRLSVRFIGEVERLDGVREDHQFLVRDAVLPGPFFHPQAAFDGEAALVDDLRDCRDGSAHVLILRESLHVKEERGAVLAGGLVLPLGEEGADFGPGLSAFGEFGLAIGNGLKGEDDVIGRAVFEIVGSHVGIPPCI